jgi:phosphomethylpyrimidine synthase
MNAIPTRFVESTTRVSAEVARPMPGSRKVYVQGSRRDIQVGMREVVQAHTTASFGAETNPPIPVYDTSGPYTDPNVSVDLLRGVPALREVWIDERADTEQLLGPSSNFGKNRQADPTLAALRFKHLRAPRRALSGRNVAQMHYARQGVITPEMEYIAIRENLRREEFAGSPLAKQHLGERFGAHP